MTEIGGSTTVSSSVARDRAAAVARLQQQAPAVYTALALHDQQSLAAWAVATDADQAFAAIQQRAGGSGRQLSDFQKLVALQVLFDFFRDLIIFYFVFNYFLIFNIF
jgi:hypothetical protein